MAVQAAPATLEVVSWVERCGRRGWRWWEGPWRTARTCPRCSNAAGLNTHAGTPRHASIAPEVPRKIILSPRLVPNALLLATSHLLNITSVSTIRMLAGVWAAVHARACAHLEATSTSSALQEQPRFKLQAWHRFCRKAPTGSDKAPTCRRSPQESGSRIQPRYGNYIPSSLWTTPPFCHTFPFSY